MAYTDFNRAGRQIAGSIQWTHNGTAQDFSSSDNLVEFSVSRTAPQGKLFGFILSETLEVKLINFNSTIDIGDSLKWKLTEANESSGRWSCEYSITEVSIDDSKNEVLIKAVDTFTQNLKSHTFSELNLTYPTTPTAIYNAMGFVNGQYNVPNSLNFSFEEEELNLTGNDTWYNIVNWLLEITCSIAGSYYENNLLSNFFIYPLLYSSTINQVSIGKTNYFNLKYAEDVVLTGVMSATELGDNVLGGDDTGYVQTIWNNPLLGVRSDVQTIMNTIVAYSSNYTLTPYTLEYRGNPYVYGFTSLVLSTMDDTTLTKTRAYTNKMIYNGGLKATAEWSKGEEENVESSGPTTIGESLNNTFARVDRVNNEITIQAGKINGVNNEITTIKGEVGSLNSTVSSTKAIAEEAQQSANQVAQDLETYQTQINQTTSNIRLSVEHILDGTDAVRNVETTCATLDDSGLTVKQTNFATETLINAEGLEVHKSNDTNDKLLEAKVEGGVGVVRTANLESQSYIIINGRSRIENYTDENNPATGIFWIGG